jgi:hypothetical protein
MNSNSIAHVFDDDQFDVIATAIFPVCMKPHLGFADMTQRFNPVIFPIKEKVKTANAAIAPQKVAAKKSIESSTGSPISLNGR